MKHTIHVIYVGITLSDRDRTTCSFVTSSIDTLAFWCYCISI